MKKSINKTWNTLSPTTQQGLLLLSPFGGTINISQEILSAYFKLLGQRIPSIEVEKINWSTCLSEAVQFGIATSINTSFNPIFIKVSPLVQWFLVNEAKKHFKKKEMALLQSSFYALYQQLIIPSLANSIHKGLDEEHQLALTEFIALDYANIEKNFWYILSNNGDITASLWVVDQGFKLQQNFQEGLHFSEQAINKIAKISAKDTTNATNYIAIIDTLGHALADLGFHQKAYDAFQKALTLYQKSFPDATKNLGLLYNNIGYVCIDLNRYEESLTYLKKGLAIFKKYKQTHLAARSLLNIGSAYLELEQYEESKKHYETALKIQKTQTNTQELAELYRSLGLVSYKLKDGQKSQYYYEEALQRFQSLTDEVQEGLVLNQLGIIQLNAKEFSISDKLLKQALAIYIDKDLIEKQAGVYQNLGQMHKELQQLEDANAYFEKALDIFEQQGDEAAIYSLKEDIGLIFQLQKRYPESDIYFKEALVYYRQTNQQKSIGRILLSLGNNLVLQGIYESSFFYYEEAYAIFKKIKDTIHEGMALLDMGVACAGIKNYQQSKIYYWQAAVLFKAANNTTQLNNIFANIKRLATKSGDETLVTTFSSKFINQ